MWLSPASYWEIAIKISRGKFSVEGNYESFWEDGLERNRISVLPIEIRHTARLIELPYHHADPFDRLIVAQALADDLTLISADAGLDRYGVRRVW
jgi:PIN domain nuclease of toxin-antitoxin system